MVISESRKRFIMIHRAKEDNTCDLCTDCPPHLTYNHEGFDYWICRHCLLEYFEDVSKYIEVSSTLGPR